MLKSMGQVAIVVPVFNESRRLETEKFAAFAEAHPDVCFYFVDDGSTDGTAALIEPLTKRSGRLRLVIHAHNQGKAEAVRTGFLEALRHGPEFVGFWDADLATPLDTIAEMAAYLRAAPGVQSLFGSRVKLLGRDIRRHTVRHYLGRVFATCASLVLQLEIYDTQCGAKLFRAAPLLEECFREPFQTRWIFDVELIARMLCRQKQGEAAALQDLIHELPLRQWYDVAGSKVRSKDFFRAFFDLARVAWLYGQRLWC
jgi:dolichyl-phosphate beta-glucosyltransferase